MGGKWLQEKSKIKVDAKEKAASKRRLFYGVQDGT